MFLFLCFMVRFMPSLAAFERDNNMPGGGIWAVLASPVTVANNFLRKKEKYF